MHWQYYANTGALLSAARSARRGAPVACSVVEAFGGDASTPRELDDVLCVPAPRVSLLAASTDAASLSTAAWSTAPSC
jgi:hypothetical protein